MEHPSWRNSNTHPNAFSPQPKRPRNTKARMMRTMIPMTSILTGVIISRELFFLLSAYKYRNFFSVILRKTKFINCHNVFYSTWFPIFLFYYSYFLPPFKDAKGFFLTCVQSLGNLFICHMRIIVNKFGNGFSFLGIQILRHKHIIKPWGRC